MKKQSAVQAILQLELAESDTLKQRVEFLLQQYQVIFEVNIRAQKDLVELNRLLSENSAGLTNILEADTTKCKGFDKTKLIGNSISIDDISEFKFFSNKVDGNLKQAEFDEWLQTLPS